MPDILELRTALLGRDAPRSLLALGLAVGLGLGFYLLGALAEARGWMYGFPEQLPLVVLLVLIVGGAIAAGNAAWNDGLVVSWLLVFAPVVGWLWHVFVQGPVSFDRAVVPTAFATLAALVVGTGGYVAGRSTDVSIDPEPWDEPSNWLPRLLVGADPARSARWVSLAGGLFVLAGALIYARPYHPLPVEGVVLFELFYPTGVLVADTVLGVVVVLAWMGLAAWPAYRRAGLLASWAITFGPLFGAILTDFVAGGTSGGGPWIDAVLAFIAALSFALVLGTGGYLLGAGARRVAAGVAPPGARIRG